MENKIQIGAQIWMDRNLNVAHFLNGDTIPEAKTAEEWKSAGENEKPAWCYYNNNPLNGEKYGKLYNWYAVNDPRGLAPSGWRLPEGNDLFQMLIFLNADGLDGPGFSHNIFKACTGWENYEYFEEKQSFGEYFFETTGKFVSGNGTNESGLNVLPGGGRSRDGGFMYIGNNAFFWTLDQLITPPLEDFNFDELRYGDQLGLIKLDNYYLKNPVSQNTLNKKALVNSRVLVFGLHSYVEYDPVRDVSYYNSIFNCSNKESGFSVRCIKKIDISISDFLSAVNKNGDIFKFAGAEIKKNKELVLAAVQNNGNMLEYAFDNLKDDSEIVLVAIQQNGSALQFASDNLKGVRDIVLVAVQQNGSALQFASYNLKGDRDIVLVAVQQNGSALQFASDSLKGDRDIVLVAVQKYSLSIKHASDNLKDDKEVALVAVHKNGNALEYVSDNLKGDKEVALVAVQENGRALQFASNNIKDDKQIVLVAVQKYSLSLKYASNNLKDDKQIVLAAVQQNCRALEYASDNLKDDKEVVMVAVQKDGTTIEHASTNLRSDKEIILISIITTVEVCSEFLYDEENLARMNYNIEKIFSQCSESNLKSVLLFLIGQDYFADFPLPFELNDELSNDRNFILDALKINTNILYNASDNLKDDKEVVMFAVQNNGVALQYASAKLKDDKEIVMLSVQQNGLSLAYASEKLKRDSEIVIEAFNNNKKSIGYADKTLKPQIHLPNASYFL